MKRLFWLGVGAVAGSYVTRRATRAAHAVTPSGIGENLADGLRESRGWDEEQVATYFDTVLPR